jgi:hypothetical protein
MNYHGLLYQRVKSIGVAESWKRKFRGTAEEFMKLSKEEVDRFHGADWPDPQTADDDPSDDEDRVYLWAGVCGVGLESNDE